MTATVPLTRGDEADAIATFGVAPRTTAVPLLPPDATEQQWHAARRTAVGASECAAVIGASPGYTSAFALWWQKTNGWEVEGTRGMRVGTMLEPVIAELFREDYPGARLYRPGAALWAHPVFPWMVCTPDFLAVFPDDPTVVVPVECKSDEGGGGWGPAGTPEVPEHHRIQGLCQAHIFGSLRVFLARLQGKRFTAHPIDVDLASDEYARWTLECSRFLTSIEVGIAPDVDGSDATTEMLQRVYAHADAAGVVTLSQQLVDEYRRAGQSLRQAKVRYAMVQNQIRWELGQAVTGVDREGRTVAQRRIFKRRGYDVPPAMIDQLVPVTTARHLKGDTQ